MQRDNKAPQRKLQSSWREEVFKKPGKRGTIINYSVGTRSPSIVKSMGSLVEKKGCNTGYLY
jgi:hypothetical protein